MHFVRMGYNPVMGTIIDLSTPIQKKSSSEEDFSRSRFDTELIHLQNYDNFYSLMDRLNQLDASGESSHRILLLWPARGRILESPLEFGRLRSWAERNYYEIALVIPGNKLKRKMAAEQGISAFENVNEASEKEWISSSKRLTVAEESDRLRKLIVLKGDAEKTVRTKSSLGIRLFAFLLTLAVLLGVCYAILPQARVEITPYLVQKSINMTIWTDDRLDVPTIAGGIPTEEKRFELNLSAEVPASGIVQTEPGIAVGEILIENSCDRVTSASAGVQVGTAEDFEQGVNFITLEDVVLAPGEERVVRIEAVNGGEDGNLAEGSIEFAEYPESLCWNIRQAQPTRGGTSGTYRSPSEADLKNAQEQIDEQIQKAALSVLENDPDGYDLLPLGDAVVTAVKSIKYSPEMGFAADTLSVREVLEVSYKTIRRSDMEMIVRGQASRMNLQAGGLTGYEILSGPIEKNGLMTWDIKADYLVYEPQTNEEALQIMLRGKTLEQADSILQTLDHVKSAKITILPSILKRMPLTAQNIRVVIYPAVEEEK